MATERILFTENESDQQLVQGGAGAGKTQYLMDKLTEEIKAGTSPEKIAIVTHSKAAIGEFMRRAALDLPEAKICAKTFHGHAFHYLQMKRSDVAAPLDKNDLSGMRKSSPVRKLYEELGQELDMTFSALAITQQHEYITDYRMLQIHEHHGDWFLNLISYAQNRRISLKEAYYAHAKYPLFTLEEALRVCEKISRFLDDRNLVSFGAMLDTAITAVKTVPPPQYEVLIMDEMQDASILQWDFAKAFFGYKLKRAFIAYDKNQAIHEWAGATPGMLKALAGREHVLPRSYRLKSEVFDYCQKILNKRRSYSPDGFMFFEDGGMTRHYGELQQLKQLSPANGDWLLLVRNNYQLAEVVTYLKSKFLPYTCPKLGFSSGTRESSDCVTAISAWETLKAGSSITPEAAETLYSFLVSRRVVEYGFKSTNFQDIGCAVTMDFLTHKAGLIHTDGSWMSVMNVPSEDAIYMDRVIEKWGLDALIKNNIRVETIHASKGKEATNVVVFGHLSKNTWLTYSRDPDSEHMLFYVACSRAKENLYVVSDCGPMDYVFPRRDLFEYCR